MKPCIYNSVKAPTDGLLDSKYLLNLSDMGAEMTRQMRLEADAFDVDEFMHLVSRLLGAGIVSLQESSLDAETSMETANTESWDWARLGRLAVRHSRRVPIADHLLGPLQVTPRHRKVTRTSRLDTDAVQTAPSQLNLSDMAQSENETSKLVLDIERRLEACSDGEKGVNLFHFALNPHSFGESVENLFYISFLIRDGKAAIVENDEGDPMLSMYRDDMKEKMSIMLTMLQCCQRSPQMRIVKQD